MTDGLLIDQIRFEDQMIRRVFSALLSCGISDLWRYLKLTTRSKLSSASCDLSKSACCQVIVKVIFLHRRCELPRKATGEMSIATTSNPRSAKNNALRPLPQAMSSALPRGISQ